METEYVTRERYTTLEQQQAGRSASRGAGRATAQASAQAAGQAPDQAYGPTPHGSHRRHMGTATSDPQYLPLTDDERRREAAIAKEQQMRAAITGQDPAIEGDRPAHPVSREGRPQLTHSARYLQTPKPGRSIFISRHDRRRQQIRLLITILIVAVIVFALVWFFVLK